MSLCFHNNTDIFYYYYYYYYTNNQNICKDCFYLNQFKSVYAITSRYQADVLHSLIVANFMNHKKQDMNKPSKLCIAKI